MNFKAILLKHTLMGLMMLIPFGILAQKKEIVHIDSLLKQLHTASEDTNKVRLLLNTGVSYSNTKKPDSAIFYDQQARQLSAKLHWKKGIALSCFSLGYHYVDIKKDYVNAQNYLNEAVSLSFEIKDYGEAYNAARYIAAAIVFQNRAPENIKYLISFAVRLQKFDQPAWLAKTYFLIGDYSKYFSSYDAAMDYYDRALKLEETMHRQYLESSEVISIASFYIDLHHLDKAKAFSLRAVAMDEKARNLPALADAYLSLAYYATAAHDGAAVMDYYDKALQAARKANNNSLLCSIENEISWNYLLKKDYNQAYIHAKGAISYGTAGFSPLAYAQGTMACIYRDAPDSIIAKAGLKPNQRYERSAALLIGAIDFGKKSVDFELISTCMKELSLTYEKMHRYADAYKTYKTYITRRDSTDSLKNEKVVLLKEAQRDYSHKEESLRDRQNITNAELKEKKLQSYFFIGGIAGLLILSVFIWLNFNNQRKSNTLLAQANDQITKANHELSEQREEITSQRDQLVDTVSNLKKAQHQLIHSEKMASLGELTAGIAHEIQNPLNFVNNFSEVSAEMIGELKEELAKGDIEEAVAIATDVEQNLEKILHHGKRADGIVKGMLEHSRASTGQKEPADLNKLADEYLRLAYHGLRAKDKSFNAKLVTNFDENLPPINIIPQDIGRVLLNLFNNAFYAVQQRQLTADDGYKPAIEVMTQINGQHAMLTVNDNGIGIPDVIKDKVMQPFFTTKPTGQGTGLGLSLSYDIIVKGHGGQLTATSEEGKFAQFEISIPI